jgi:hypothetical protein
MKPSLGVTLALVAALCGCTLGCASRQHSARPNSSASSPSSSVAVQQQLSGSYLMQPPMRHGKPDTGAQLANWQVLAFFNRGDQCDEARARGLSAYATYLPTSAGASTDSVQVSQRLASSTRCVAADDPRINWFHIRWK